MALGNEAYTGVFFPSPDPGSYACFPSSPLSASAATFPNLTDPVLPFFYTKPNEVLTSTVELCVFLGLIFNIPYFLYSIYTFLKPGLYNFERYEYRFKICSIILRLSLLILISRNFIIPSIIKALMPYDLIFIPKISENIEFYFQGYISILLLWCVLLL